MTIELKNKVSPPVPSRRGPQDTVAPRVEEPRFTTSRELKLPEGSKKEVAVGGVLGTIHYKAPTAKQVAVVYADDRMRTALIASCLIAEGKDVEEANRLAASALGACYHGGNKELEKLGIEAPAIILPIAKRDGGVIAHELAHALGGSEREAIEAQIKYLERRKVTERPEVDLGHYPNPELRPHEEGKIISLAIGPVGGGGGWHNYNPNRIPRVNRVEPAAKVNRVEGVKRADSVQLGANKATESARSSSHQSEESAVKLAAEIAGAVLAAAAATAAEIAARIARLFGKPPPSPTEDKVSGVSGAGGAGMNPGQHGHGRSQGGKQRDQAPKGKEKRES